jgi:plasmid stability protein
LALRYLVRTIRPAIICDSAAGVGIMAQLLVRDLDEELVRLLKQRAASHGRSAEAEHRVILEQALRPSGEPFWQTARRLQAETRGRGGPDGAEIIRQHRETHRHGGGDG